MNPINVAKFGGTSVANFEAMSLSAHVIEQNQKTHLIVISACSGVTNLLVELANGVQDNQRKKAIFEELKSIHFSILDQLADPIYPEQIGRAHV